MTDLYLATREALMSHVDKHQNADIEEITYAFADAIGDALALYYQPTADELDVILMTIKNRINRKIEGIQLREFAEHLVDADAVAGYIDYVQGEVEDGSIDHVCSTIDAVHELRKEIIAWGLQ